MSISRHKISLAAVAVVLLLAALLVALSPVEATLGDGIRIVYVHVALTWTGMLGIAVAGLLGLGVLLSGRPALHAWMRKTGWVALGVFALGFVISALAEQINWGAVFWQEPRMRAYMDTLALAIIVSVLDTWLPRPRVHGLLHAALAAFMAVTMTDAASVLHPDSALRSSSAPGIQFAFVGLFVDFRLHYSQFAIKTGIVRHVSQHAPRHPRPDSAAGGRLADSGHRRPEPLGG